MSTTLSFSHEDNSFLAMRTGKWTLVVVAELSAGTRRFNELRRSMDGISQKTLASTLRELERDGFISRTAFATIPPRVDYELTALGRDLLDLVDACRAFVARNRDAVASARQNFDLSNNISLR
ncbi:MULTISPECIES: winged helix-turn-helix transcriptional regulator [unclassified Devosia]|uniref:winged helix-turn-helix transcriptional regulator n=1 Tax=unclassified Devosia TaxID=196773 RepID=UPI0025D8C81A|nr:helix-turn-helix domain-containing protein [Devosia sp.]MCR6635567.1 helix-turn-helix transcriptional regulator [Devosia sp.]